MTLAARQIENVLLEERDAIALPHWHFTHRTLNTERPASKTAFCNSLAARERGKPPFAAVDSFL
jgi:hypothetical protein